MLPQAKKLVVKFDECLNISFPRTTLNSIHVAKKALEHAIALSDSSTAHNASKDDPTDLGADQIPTDPSSKVVTKFLVQLDLANIIAHTLQDILYATQSKVSSSDLFTILQTFWITIESCIIPVDIAMFPPLDIFPRCMNQIKQILSINISDSLSDSILLEKSERSLLGSQEAKGLSKGHAIPLIRLYPLLVMALTRVAEIAIMRESNEELQELGISTVQSALFPRNFRVGYSEIHSNIDIFSTSRVICQGFLDSSISIRTSPELTIPSYQSNRRMSNPFDGSNLLLLAHGRVLMQAITTLGSSLNYKLSPAASSNVRAIMNDISHVLVRLVENNNSELDPCLYCVAPVKYANAFNNMAKPLDLTAISANLAPVDSSIEVIELPLITYCVVFEDSLDTLKVPSRQFDLINFMQYCAEGIPFQLVKCIPDGVDPSLAVMSFALENAIISESNVHSDSLANSNSLNSVSFKSLLDDPETVSEKLSNLLSSSEIGLPLVVFSLPKYPNNDIPQHVLSLRGSSRWCAMAVRTIEAICEATSGPIFSSSEFILKSLGVIVIPGLILLALTNEVELMQRAVHTLLHMYYRFHQQLIPEFLAFFHCLLFPLLESQHSSISTRKTILATLGAILKDSKHILHLFMAYDLNFEYPNTLQSILRKLSQLVHPSLSLPSSESRVIEGNNLNEPTASSSNFSDTTLTPKGSNKLSSESSSNDINQQVGLGKLDSKGFPLRESLQQSSLSNLPKNSQSLEKIYNPVRFLQQQAILTLLIIPKTLLNSLKVTHASSGSGIKDAPPTPNGKRLTISKTLYKENPKAIEGFIDSHSLLDTENSVKASNNDMPTSSFTSSLRILKKYQTLIAVIDHFLYLFNIKCHFQKAFEYLDENSKLLTEFLKGNLFFEGKENKATVVSVDSSLYNDQNTIGVSEENATERSMKQPVENFSIEAKHFSSLGNTKFNKSPTESSIHSFSFDSVSHALIFNDKAISFFLYYNEPKIDKISLGKFFGTCFQSSSHKAIFEAWVKNFDFRNLLLDEALRQFLGSFKIVGEAQVVEKTMECFASHYFSQNPFSFSSVDTVFMLSFSICLLNTDAHSIHVKNKMSLTEFIRNNDKIDGGKNIDSRLLTGIYERITEKEIILRPSIYLLLSNQSSPKNISTITPITPSNSSGLRGIPFLRFLLPSADSSATRQVSRPPSRVNGYALYERKTGTVATDNSFYFFNGIVQNVLDFFSLVHGWSAPVEKNYNSSSDDFFLSTPRTTSELEFEAKNSNEISASSIARNFSRLVSFFMIPEKIRILWYITSSSVSQSSLYLLESLTLHDRTSEKNRTEVDKNKKVEQPVVSSTNSTREMRIIAATQLHDLLDSISSIIVLSCYFDMVGMAEGLMISLYKCSSVEQAILQISKKPGYHIVRSLSISELLTLKIFLSSFLGSDSNVFSSQIWEKAFRTLSRISYVCYSGDQFVERTSKLNQDFELNTSSKASPSTKISDSTSSDSLISKQTSQNLPILDKVEGTVSNKVNDSVKANISKLDDMCASDTKEQDPKPTRKVSKASNAEFAEKPMTTPNSTVSNVKESTITSNIMNYEHASRSEFSKTGSVICGNISNPTDKNTTSHDEVLRRGLAKQFEDSGIWPIFATHLYDPTVYKKDSLAKMIEGMVSVAINELSFSQLWTMNRLVEFVTICVSIVNSKEWSLIWKSTSSVLIYASRLENSFVMEALNAYETLVIRYLTYVKPSSMLNENIFQPLETIWLNTKDTASKSRILLVMRRIIVVRAEYIKNGWPIIFLLLGYCATDSSTQSDAWDLLLCILTKYLSFTSNYVLSALSCLSEFIMSKCTHDETKFGALSYIFCIGLWLQKGLISPPMEIATSFSEVWKWVYNGFTNTIEKIGRDGSIDSILLTSQDGSCTKDNIYILFASIPLGPDNILQVSKKNISDGLESDREDEKDELVVLFEYWSHLLQSLTIIAQENFLSLDIRLRAIDTIWALIEVVGSYFSAEFLQFIYQDYFLSILKSLLTEGNHSRLTEKFSHIENNEFFSSLDSPRTNSNPLKSTLSGKKKEKQNKYPNSPKGSQAKQSFHRSSSSKSPPNNTFRNKSEGKTSEINGISSKIESPSIRHLLSSVEDARSVKEIFKGEAISKFLLKRFLRLSLLMCLFHSNLLSPTLHLYFSPSILSCISNLSSGIHSTFLHEFSLIILINWDLITNFSAIEGFPYDFNRWSLSSISNEYRDQITSDPSFSAIYSSFPWIDEVWNSFTEFDRASQLNMASNIENKDKETNDTMEFDRLGPQSPWMRELFFERNLFLDGEITKDSLLITHLNSFIDVKETTLILSHLIPKIKLFIKDYLISDMFQCLADGFRYDNDLMRNQEKRKVWSVAAFEFHRINAIRQSLEVCILLSLSEVDFLLIVEKLLDNLSVLASSTVTFVSGFAIILQTWGFLLTQTMMNMNNSTALSSLPGKLSRNIIDGIVRNRDQCIRYALGVRNNSPGGQDETYSHSTVDESSTPMDSSHPFPSFNYGPNITISDSVKNIASLNASNCYPMQCSDENFSLSNGFIPSICDVFPIYRYSLSPQRIFEMHNFLNSENKLSQWIYLTSFESLRLIISLNKFTTIALFKFSGILSLLSSLPSDFEEKNLAIFCLTLCQTIFPYNVYNIQSEDTIRFLTALLSNSSPPEK